MFAFFREETGAVTVDWVVLTAAVVGLGLATTAVVSAGVGDLSNGIADNVANVSVQERFSRLARAMGFENGSGTWLGGTVSYDDAYGHTLRGGGGSGQQAQNTFSLSGDSDYAVLSFDMHAIDSWDGETFDIYVDNALVASASFQFSQDGATGTWASDNPDYTFAMEATTPRAQSGYSTEWTDQSYRMQVTVANPGNEVTLGFGSSLDQGIEDESWAVDNVSVTETNSI